MKLPKVTKSKTKLLITPKLQLRLLTQPRRLTLLTTLTLSHILTHCQFLLRRQETDLLLKSRSRLRQIKLQLMSNPPILLLKQTLQLRLMLLRLQLSKLKSNQTPLLRPRLNQTLLTLTTQSHSQTQPQFLLIRLRRVILQTRRRLSQLLQPSLLKLRTAALKPT